MRSIPRRRRLKRLFASLRCCAIRALDSRRYGGMQFPPDFEEGMSPLGDRLLRKLGQAGWFYCQPCLNRALGGTAGDRHAAWAELIAHKTIELKQALCMECLQPRTVMRISPITSN